MRRLTAILFFAIILCGALLLAAGCGSKTGLSQETYGKIQNGMTLDDVEAVAGQPERSHKLGTATNQAQTIYWYYTKTDGEGLVKVGFENGKVTSISPYDTSVTPEE